MDGNKDDLHVFQQQDIPTQVCTPLGFNYDTHIDGSIASLVEYCNLINIHKLKHGDVPATHNAGSHQIDLGFLSYGTSEFIHRCGVLDLNALFSSDHRALFLDIDILRLLGYPVQGTLKSLEREFKLNDPFLVEVYQSSLCKHLVTHNAASRIDSLIVIKVTAWLPAHQAKFNKIDKDIDRAMKCAANARR
jgi:hypothetical protein